MQSDNGQTILSLNLATGTITSKCRIYTLRYQYQLYNILTLFSKKKQTIWLQNSAYMQLKTLCIYRYSFNESLVTTFKGYLKKHFFTSKSQRGKKAYTEKAQRAVEYGPTLSLTYGVVNSTPRPFYPQEGDPVPIVQEGKWDPLPV